MVGIVKEINIKKDMCAIQTDDGYTIIETFGDDIDEGDTIKWVSNEPLGHEKIKNITKNEIYEVYFQNHHVNESNLRKQLLY